jgi:hypothetical protein
MTQFKEEKELTEAVLVLVPSDDNILAEWKSCLQAEGVDDRGVIVANCNILAKCARGGECDALDSMIDGVLDWIRSLFFLRI